MFNEQAEDGREVRLGFSSHKLFVSLPENYETFTTSDVQHESHTRRWADVENKGGSSASTPLSKAQPCLSEL
jgi:hypothetical protein